MPFTKCRLKRFIKEIEIRRSFLFLSGLLFHKNLNK